MSPVKNIIGEGENGIISPVKGTKRLTVKIEKTDAWSPVDEEGKFFKDNKLSKESLFIPTKAVNKVKRKPNKKLKNTY